MLILMQSIKREDKNFVGICNSFANWKKQKITVNKGSKGYKVLVPIFKKIKVLMVGESEEKEQEKQQLAFFRIGHVFDISQTSAYEKYLKEEEMIEEKIMKNTEINYNTAMQFIDNNKFEVEIIEDFKDIRNGDEKGKYNPKTKTIEIYERSSHTLFHEIGHHITDFLDIMFDNWQINTSSYSKNEILAEISCYLLMKEFNAHHKYNLAYSNAWSSRIKDNFEFDDFEKRFVKIEKFVEKLNKNTRGN